MIDHITVTVSSYETSKAFYAAALAPLGYQLIREFEFGPIGGFGVDGKPDFWIRQDSATTAVHVAFASSERATVDAFHQAALAAGGKDNGAPGPRPQYHPDYYGAFVLDPDGHNVEAVCHTPQS